MIRQVETHEDPDSVYVDVTPLHHTNAWLHAISVCSLERQSGEQGVAIFVSVLDAIRVFMLRRPAVANQMEI